MTVIQQDSQNEQFSNDYRPHYAYYCLPLKNTPSLITLNTEFTTMRPRIEQ